MQRQSRVPTRSPRRPERDGGAARRTGPRSRLELNQDQKDIRDWVHGFAEDVVRPAAAEWDEREETPWPVIQEAAKIGLYGFEGLAQFWADETGLTLPIANEELFWGDAGIGMSIMGTSLAVAAIFGQGTARADGRVDPAVLRQRRRPEGRRVLLLRARRRLRRLRDPHHRQVRRGQATSGSSTARRPGRPTAASPTSTSSSPRSTASSARAATPPSSSRPAPRAASRAPR